MPIRSASGTLSHTLRVYLIDRDRRIRDIYSQSLLHADVVLAGIRTLRMSKLPRVQ